MNATISKLVSTPRARTTKGISTNKAGGSRNGQPLSQTQKDVFVATASGAGTAGKVKFSVTPKELASKAFQQTLVSLTGQGIQVSITMAGASKTSKASKTAESSKPTNSGATTSPTPYSSRSSSTWGGLSIDDCRKKIASHEANLRSPIEGGPRYEMIGGGNQKWVETKGELYEAQDEYQGYLRMM